MYDTERDLVPKHGSNDQNIILEEYNSIIESLKRDLRVCKTEQDNIRAELDVLRNENRSVHDVQDSFNRIHTEECCDPNSHKKELTNLEERIALLQTEKDSVMQLWHISLNTIDVLEEELKSFCIGGKDPKFYQEQANKIKETYSEAIKALEGKLLQAKENFVQQQVLCQTNKEKVESLSKEKNEITRKFADFQKEAQDRDRDNKQTIETLKKELAYARTEIKNTMQLKLETERKLGDTKLLVENLVGKDKETKLKMAEAIELIESAVREKDLVLHREALVLEEKARLEVRVSAIASEYDAKIQELSLKLKNEHEQIEKKYALEINDLKSDLREKTAGLDKAQREVKLTEEELQKVRRESEEMLHKSNVKIQDYEKKLKEMELQLQVHDELKLKTKHDAEIKQLKHKISTLEGKLITSNNKLKKLEQQTFANTECCIKQPDRRNKDFMEQNANLERQLARTLGDKEDLLLQLKSLKHDFEYEIHRRDNERHSLENKIRGLEINLQKASSTRQNNASTERLYPYPENDKSKPTLDITVQNKCHCCQSADSDHVIKLQEKFDKKTKELIQHVQVHQKLSRRWRDEAKSLTARFQGKTKELRTKINRLQKENRDLCKKVLECRQELAQNTMQEIQRFNEANEIR